MSTRCLIQIVDNGEVENSLYCHHDGYPENIIPVIQKAWFYRKDHDVRNHDYATPSKVASVLCWANPIYFEPRCDNNLIPDISYLYQIYLVTAVDDQGKGYSAWELSVFTPKFIDYIDNHCMENMDCIAERIPVSEITKGFLDHLINLIEKNNSKMSSEEMIKKLKQSKTFFKLIKNK